MYNIDSTFIENIRRANGVVIQKSRCVKNELRGEAIDERVGLCCSECFNVRNRIPGC